jgi:putative glycosyltransferase
MKRAYVNALLALPERNVFLGGMFVYAGFRQVARPIKRDIIRKRSTYSTLARFRLALTSIVAFSVLPLQIISMVGFLIALLAGATGVVFTIRKVIWPETILSGFTALFVSIWFIGGAILMALGVVGLYIAHIYNDTRGRPRAIVRQIHRFEV